MSTKKLKVGVLGATGMGGQRFLALLENHPWYEVNLVAASASSAGKSYADRLKQEQKKTGNVEGVKTGIAYIKGRRVALGGVDALMVPRHLVLSVRQGVQAVGQLSIRSLVHVNLPYFGLVFKLGQHGPG